MTAPPQNESSSGPLRRRAQAARFALRWQLRSVALGNAFLEGAILGLLDRRDLQSLTEATYSRNPQYMNSEYVQMGLFPWERRVLERYFQGCRSVVLAAAGAGREVLALEALGIRVTGFECNRTLREQANAMLAARGMASEVRTAEPDIVPAGLGTHDGAIVGWGAYSLIMPRAARVRFLREMAACLGGRGPLLVSFLTRNPEDRTDRLRHRIARLLRALRLSREALEPGDRLPLNHLESFLHFVTREELESELLEAGLQCAHYSEEDYGHCVAHPAGL